MAFGSIDQTQVDGLVADLGAKATDADLTAHESNTSNPHSVTAAQINAIPTSEKGVANGVATLDAQGKVPQSQIPALAMERLNVVANQTVRYALTTNDVQEGDIVKQTDTGATYVVVDDTNLNNAGGYTMLTSASSAPVDSVHGRIGHVVGETGDYDSDQIDNNSTVNGGAGSVSDAMEANAASIATNASDISTNTSDISTNTGNIGTNTTNIGTNATNIATNVSDIATNASDIDALEAAVKPAIHHTPSGSSNGANTDFTIKKLDGTTTVAADTDRTLVTLKRLPQIPGVDFTWQAGNTIIRFGTAPLTGWPVTVWGQEA